MMRSVSVCTAKGGFAHGSQGTNLAERFSVFCSSIHGKYNCGVKRRVRHGLLLQKHAEGRFCEMLERTGSEQSPYKSYPAT